MWPGVEVKRWLLTANSLKILCSCTKALAAELLRGECFVILHFHVDLVMVKQRQNWKLRQYLWAVWNKQSRVACRTVCSTAWRW